MPFYRSVSIRTRSVLLIAAVCFFASAAPCVAAVDDSGKYLFICTGDQARKSPDFLAVVNFDERSSQYGRVIGKADVQGPVRLAMSSTT